MADISKIKLPGGSTAYNVKDSTARSGLEGKQATLVDSGTGQNIKTIDTTATAAQSTSSGESLLGTGKITLHKVSKTGSYNDLLNKPTIPTDTNQKVKTSTVTFGNNDVVEIVGGTNVSVSGDATAKTITISATDTDTGATSIETTGSGNAVTTASYSADTRKITLTKGSTFLTSHQNIKTLDTTATTAQSTSSNEAIKGSGTVTLHKVSKTGSYNDLLNKPTIPTVNDATLTIKVEGTSKGTFTANASSDVEIDITASDLGLSGALKYRGVATTTKPSAGKYIQTVIGSTTYYTSITSTGAATQQNAALGDVIAVGSVEYVCTTAGASGTNVFTQIGDESSYALKSITVTGTGALGGGGTLQSNRTITHNAGNAASKSSGLYKISTDAYSHVASATAVEKADITALGIPAQDTTYSVATSDTAGLVKSSTTGTTASRNYNVEVNSDGTMKVNVPWTNTATASDNILDGSNSGTAITYKPYTSQQSKLSFDTSTTAPSRTDRLNLNGYLYATKLYSGGTEVLTAHQTIPVTDVQVDGSSVLDGTVAKITMPTELKNPNKLNIKVNDETSNFVEYDGSAAKTITVKPSSTNGAFIINDGTANKTIQLAGNFSNTATAADNILDGSNSGTQITYKPYTAQQSKLSFDTSTTAPTRTDRLNLNGYLYATKLYSGGTEVQTAITGAATSITSSNLTTSKALVSNSNGKVAASSVTSTELGYLSGKNDETWTFTLADGTTVTKKIIAVTVTTTE